MIAVDAALVVVGYYELSEEDRPPRSMWHNSERLEEWFAAVKERWKNPDLRKDEAETRDWTANSLTEQYR